MREEYIPGTDRGYKIREDGEIESHRYPHKPRFLSHRYNPKGYRVATLKFGHSFKTVYLHRLVARTFIPNPDNKPQVNHIDGNKDNPDVSNLEWVTASENIKHSVEVLGNSRGEKNGGSKLDIHQARWIKYGSDGLLHKDIAKHVGCSDTLVSYIKSGKIWKYI